MPTKKNIFLFGDSITYGEWDSSGGWAARLRDHFDSLQLPLPSEFVITYNLGIPGDTSEGVAQRLTQETQSRLTPNQNEQELQFIIAIGTNDSRWSLEDKTYETDIEQFKTNIENISKSASVFSDDIVFIGLLPCIEADVLETGKRHDWDVTYDNQSISRYNQVIKKHCEEEGHEFIDMFTVFERLNENLNNEPLFCDGLHPTDYGHAKIFDEVISCLNRLENLAKH